VTDLEVLQALVDHPFGGGLGPALAEQVAACAALGEAAPGQVLFREGGPADTFYLVRAGRVALEVPAPGGAHVVDTAHGGDVVGWSWAVPPHRWLFDARATEPTTLVVVDAVCLRAACDRDPALGHAVLQRVLAVVSGRLHSARVRLLDLYGSPA
jgi:CRP-like cAMP-binding protein